ncbi:MAG: SseB family protein, partial [Haloechinothrix sp.]
MTAEWRPATGSEQALLNAVTTGDEDGYLAELARGTLWVPVLPDDTTWMTADQDGRRYLMGYTSEAMFRAAFRGAAPPPYREVTLGQLAQT